MPVADAGSDNEEEGAAVDVEDDDKAEKKDAQPADEAAAKDINDPADEAEEKDEEPAKGNAGELITSHFRFQS